jgi:thiol-disulfide isomerase/thioredoxin
VPGHPRLHVLGGATEWLNSEPLGPAALRGHVVLVNFWTLTCINWLRTAPYVRAWSHAYEEEGLVVVGVHAPEFSFEQRIELVRRAVESRGIHHPVVLDNDYEIWNAFDNHYWPALYILDAEGEVRDFHFGEGRYAQSERSIQKLIGVERDLVSVRGVGVEADADWQHLRTPETYLGHERGDRLASLSGVALDAAHTYEIPDRLRSNRWALAGRWTIEAEKVVLDAPDGTIAFRFRARDAHVVLSSSATDQIPLRVLLDGEPPGASHGVDVDEAGNGLLGEGRLYQIVRQHEKVRERTLEITFGDAGAEAYAFTFG